VVSLVVNLPVKFELKLDWYGLVDAQRIPVRECAVADDAELIGTNAAPAGGYPGSVTSARQRTLGSVTESIFSFISGIFE
jgi:hypothetical protein